MGTSSDDLKQRLSNETKEALKGGRRVRLAALRMLSSSVHNREVELRRELTAEEFAEVATREVKRRTEALEAYEKAGRADLAAKEREEREALQTYLPPQLSDEEIDALIEEAVAQTGATSEREMGKVIGAVMQRAKGKADGSRVQARVRARLAG